jgi:hypothetical protein
MVVDVGSSDSSDSAIMLWLLNEFEIPATSTDRRSGLTLGLFGFPNTSLNLLAGDFPLTLLLMLLLRELGCRASALSTKPELEMLESGTA